MGSDRQMKDDSKTERKGLWEREALESWKPRGHFLPHLEAIFLGWRRSRWTWDEGQTPTPQPFLLPFSDTQGRLCSAHNAKQGFCTLCPLLGKLSFPATLPEVGPRDQVLTNRNVRRVRYFRPAEVRSSCYSLHHYCRDLGGLEFPRV